jgi:hypothetical protein
MLGLYPPDALEITFRRTDDRGQVSMVSERLEFYADAYEGEWHYMQWGTISPAFQDALRAAGIPAHRPKSEVEILLIDLGAHLRNRK